MIQTSEGPDGSKIRFEFHLTPQAELARDVLITLLARNPYGSGTPIAEVVKKSFSITEAFFEHLEKEIP